MRVVTGVASWGTTYPACSETDSLSRKAAPGGRRTIQDHAEAERTDAKVPRADAVGRRRQDARHRRSDLSLAPETSAPRLVMMSDDKVVPIGTPSHASPGGRQFVARSPLGERLVARRTEVLDLAARRRASNVRVFGSVVRGSDGPGSDIDLLVDLAPEARPLDLIELECEIEDLLGVRVDVGSAASLRPFLRENILTEAVPL